MKKHKPTLDSWRIFRMLSELVEGFETMTDLGPAVAVFGSARIDEKSAMYEKARAFGARITEKGFAVVTGGGPGIMEAANRGAHENNHPSCGISVDLPHETTSNPYVNHRFHMHFRYFFVRKVMLVRYAQAFVVFPGGFGSLDELFEALTLVQTRKIKAIPIYLVGTEYWSGLIDWLKERVIAEKMIDAKDLDLIQLVDDIDSVAEEIAKHYAKSDSFENF